jgi:hypothetical protein
MSGLPQVAEPYRQHGQQCPTQSKCQQDHADEDMLFRLDERGGDQNQANNEASRKRSGDDQPQCLPSLGDASLRVAGVSHCPAPSYGLNSMKIDVQQHH